MPIVTLKWFNDALGYGLIEPRDGGKKVLVHISATRRAGLASLSDGIAVSYDLVNRPGKQWQKTCGSTRIGQNAGATRPSLMAEPVLDIAKHGHQRHCKASIVYRLINPVREE